MNWGCAFCAGGLTCSAAHRELPLAFGCSQAGVWVPSPAAGLSALSAPTAAPPLQSPSGEWQHCAFICISQKSGCPPRLPHLPIPRKSSGVAGSSSRPLLPHFIVIRACSPHTYSSNVSKPYILSRHSSHKQPFVELLTCAMKCRCLSVAQKAFCDVRPARLFSCPRLLLTGYPPFFFC